MRPLLIAETVVTPSSFVEWVAGAGTLVWDRHSLRVLDPDLTVALAWDVVSPDADPILAVGVAPDRSRFALVGLREMQVRSADGRVQWSAEHGAALSTGWPQPHCHLAGDGLVWLFVPDGSGDHVVAWDSAGGSEVGRHHPLQTIEGAATVVPHADQGRVGVHIAVGPETCLSHWLTAVDRKQVVVQTLNGCLADLNASGVFFLSMPHGSGRMSVREVADDSVRVERHFDDIPGFGDSDDYRIHEAAAVVSDDWVMVGVATDQGDAEQHLLLSTRTLRPQTVMDYGIDMPQNSIRSAGGQGRWLTHDARLGVVRLWQLREPHTDEVEGQLALL
ncbi:hypothetical protein OG992_02520 [Micromonospora sp. NBC_00362]|uniref:hypothetical protein n=1 Tax=unclassified Micromonospora TaxID=2617518 RepID=UPI00224E68B8|nr:hypothetical protein [Micromonospora sp. NBC_00362]MCX5116035.1 hypothetical protein [Micromonospora sp. NBC_00362]WTI05679.1 hypothetical protein OHB44_19750 [Micromonospora sp. NBC_00821]